MRSKDKVNLNTLKLGLSLFRHQTSDSKLQAAGFGLRASGFGFRASSFGLRASGLGLRAPGSGLRAPGSGLRAPGSGLRVSGFGLQASDSGIQSSFQMMAAINSNSAITAHSNAAMFVFQLTAIAQANKYSYFYCAF